MTDTRTDTRELSERLQGIADHLTTRAAQLLAVRGGRRLTPEDMDELRHWAGVAVRGAAIEGARSAPETRASLLPVPKVGRAHAQEIAITRHDTPQKLPGGIVG